MISKVFKTIKESYGGILISFCLTFMLLFYEPLNIYASNSEDFWFDIYSFFPIILLQFLVVFLVLSIIFILLRKFSNKAYKVLVVSFLILTICSYIQGNFLSGSLSAIDGNEIDYDGFVIEKIMSLILWVGVIGGTIFFLKKYKFKVIEKATMYISLAIVFILSSTFVAILTQDEFFDRKYQIMATTENFSTMSSDKNFIIFLLDCVDSQTFNKELQKTGKANSIFKDFTYFPDTLAGYPYTRNSIPFILGGEWYENETTYTEYFTKSIDNSPLFENLQNAGYDLNLYEHTLNNYNGENYERFQNLTTDVEIDLGALFKEEAKVILFKYLPYQLKPLSNIETLLIKNSIDDKGDKELFTEDNVETFERIKNDDIEIVENKNFKYIHIHGAHRPFRYDKDLNTIENATYETNNDACVTIVETYLNKLRESGVYDNSVIIVMADHGFGDTTADRLNPILFIKGFNEHHSYRESTKKVSYANLMDAFKDLMDGKSASQLFNVDNTVRRFLYYKFYKPNVIYEQTLEGHASNSEALVPTGEKYTRK